MTTRLQLMPLDVAAWRNDPFVRSMALDVRAAYFDLLVFAWAEGGIDPKLIEDERVLAREIGCSRRLFRTYWGSFQHKFETNSRGFRVNSKMELHRENVLKRVRINRELYENRRKRPGLSNANELLNDQDSVQESESASESAFELELSTLKAIAQNPEPPASPPELKFDFAAVYKIYPRKKGKVRGLAKCKTKIKTAEQYADLTKAVEHYAKAMASEEPRFRAHFSTFIEGQWEDWINGNPDGDAKPDGNKQAYWNGKPVGMAPVAYPTKSEDWTDKI